MMSEWVLCVCQCTIMLLFSSYKEAEPTQLMCAHVRPRARYRYQWCQVRPITSSSSFTLYEINISLHHFITVECGSSSDGQL